MMLWNVLDWTPEGRGTDWYPKITYLTRSRWFCRSALALAEKVDSAEFGAPDGEAKGTRSCRSVAGDGSSVDRRDQGVCADAV
jgi:hypothetical protein